MRFFMFVALMCSGSLADAQSPIYVDSNGSGNGSSWGQATNDLQFAINNVTPGGEIWITGGLTPIQPAGAAAFLINKSVSIYGGFVGNEGAVSERPCLNVAPSVINSGPFNVTNIFDIIAPPGGSDVRLDGLLIESGGFGVTPGQGGGVRVSGSAAVNLTIDWCDFLNNFGADGGALAVLGSHSVDILRTYFGLSSTDYFGRGGCIFADGGGGALIRMHACVFNNGLADKGGAVYIKEGAGQLVNCLFVNCTADTDAVFYLEQADAEVVNCTFFSNVVPGTGTVLFTDKRGCSLDIRNTIVTLNGAMQATNAPVSCVTYSCIEGGGGLGVGNIDFQLQASHFPNINSNNYTPAAGTPVIDAGNSDVVSADIFDLDQDGVTVAEAVPYDAAGRPRFENDPQAPDAGVWALPPVDMGAFERPALLQDPPVLPCSNLEL